MKKLAFVFLGLIAFPTLAQDITAKNVIEKYINAIGGKEAIEAIEDITMKSSAEVQGQKMEILAQKKKPNKFLTIVSVDGMGEVNHMVCDGTKAKMTAMGQTQNLEGEALEALKSQNALIGELDYLNDESKLKLEGSETINGTDCYKLTISTVAGNVTEYYAKDSGLKVRQIVTSNSPMGEMTVTIDLSDYKDVGGVKLPHKMKQDMGMMAFDLNMDEIKVNSGLADVLFTVE